MPEPSDPAKHPLAWHYDVLRGLENELAYARVKAVSAELAALSREAEVRVYQDKIAAAVREGLQEF